MPHWEFVVPQDGSWDVRLALSVDTSVAQARQLSETAATGG
jgi:hypothetical protein